MRSLKNALSFMVIFLAISAATHLSPSNALAVEPKGELKMAIAISYSADWLDPSRMSTYSSHFLLYMFHDALLKPMPGGLYSPCLAESWKISPDYRVYEFNLRKGVKFHNGDEMTAEDAVFTFGRYKGLMAKLIQDRIKKVEAVNRYVFRVTFKDPFPNFFEYLLPGSASIAWIVPKKYIEKVGDDGFRKSPVGCGPYKFVEFKAGVRVVGEAFRDFWRKVPNIRRLELYSVAETSTRYAMLKRGEVDIAFSIMERALYDKAKEDKTLKLLSPVTATQFVVQMTSQWDPKSPWFDPRVRKAASLAIDRKTLCDVHAPGSTPIGSLGYENEPEGVFIPPDPYDPKQARRLLAEAGYSKGFHGGKYYPFDSLWWPMGEQVANYWKAVGISVDTELMDRVVWTERRRVGQMKGANFTDSVSQMTVGLRFDFLFGGVFSYGSYTDIQTMWDQYNKAVDPKLRKDLMGKLQNSITEKTMFIPLFLNVHSAAASLRVKGNPCKIQGLYWFPFEDAEFEG